MTIYSEYTVTKKHNKEYLLNLEKLEEVHEVSLLIALIIFIQRINTLMMLA
jgi:hypothetical protein